jgi:outer membrane protein OmpA-like peptidoglycan-associated protein
MKYTFVLAMAVALLFVGMPASAGYVTPKVWDDLSWWAVSGATPAPIKDDTVDAYWWWPTQPVSNAGDGELWGNRGKVLHDKLPMAPKPKPLPPQEVAKKRVKPVLNNVLFDFDKSILKPEGKAATGEVNAWMKKYPQDTVVVEGHTCDIGTEAYNMGLGQRRADSVASYMNANGVGGNRVSTKSFGESTPAVPNSSSANRKLNRRAVFNITLGD